MNIWIYPHECIYIYILQYIYAHIYTHVYILMSSYVPLCVYEKNIYVYVIHTYILIWMIIINAQTR